MSQARSNVGIGNFAREIIKQNPDMPNKQILDIVLEKFPGRDTSVACIAWYKADLRKHNGGVIPSATPAEVKRTQEMITNEILELECKLEDLREELKNWKDEELVSKQEMLRKLAEELGVKLPE